MKKFKLIAILLFTSFVFFSCVSVKEKKDIYVIHDIQNTDKYDTDVKIPIFANEKALNSLISNQITDWFNDFETEIKENKKGDFYVDWQLKQNSPEIISVLLSAYIYTGGANGQDKLTSFNWDTKKQKLITLDEILPKITKPANLQTLSNLCRAQLREILDIEDNNFLVQSINEGTMPVASNFQIFTITNQGVYFYFTKYQVAPGSYGIQEVFLPFIK